MRCGERTETRVNPSRFVQLKLKQASLVRRKKPYLATTGLLSKCKPGSRLGRVSLISHNQERPMLFVGCLSKP